MARMAAKKKPPVFVSGGKRLNFDRQADWEDAPGDTFSGYGKDQGCYPSGTWRELCALATVITAHPAYEPVTELPGIYQPRTEDTADTTSNQGVGRG
jgi:hypothetical protein